MTTDCNPRYTRLDPRRGAAQAVAEAARNLACVGAAPIAVTDCLNFGNPEKPAVAWQLTEAIDGLAEACRALDVPVVSGNVSLYNETAGRAIPPTPTVGMVGLLEDVALAVPSVLRQATRSFSSASRPIRRAPASTPADGPFPRFDLDAERRLARFCARWSRSGCCARRRTWPTAAWPSRWRNARCCGGTGAHTRTRSGRPEVVLFSEDQGRALRHVRPSRRQASRSIWPGSTASPPRSLGRPAATRLDDRRRASDLSLDELRAAWEAQHEAARSVRRRGHDDARPPSRPGWRSSPCTRSSTAARRAPASAPPTARACTT